MIKSLPISEKLALVKSVQSGSSVTKVCLEAGISRTVLYKWKKQLAAYGNKPHIALSGHKRGYLHWKKVPKSKEAILLKLALAHPDFSINKLGQLTQLSSSAVWQILKKQNLTLVSQRIAYKQDKQQKLKNEVDVKTRYVAMKKHERGDSVTQICKDLGICRTIFYRWLARYQAVPDFAKKASLQSQRPTGDQHWKHVVGLHENVLQLIDSNPELSIREMTFKLNKDRAKGVSVSGVYAVLRRMDLTTVSKREAYAKMHAPKLQPEVAEWVEPAPLYQRESISVIPPPLQLFKWRKPWFFLFLLLLGFFGIIFASSSLQQKIWTVSIGEVIAWISLLCGLFFFLYSLKYYLVIALVLSFSRKEGKQKENVDQKGISFSDILSPVLGSHLAEANGPRSVKAYPASLANHNGLYADISDVRLEEKPFVSIHLATYNEKRVIDRLLTAATSMLYDNYEVILVDDSTDETVEIVRKWEHHQRVKVIHRGSRDGFKGGALRKALEAMDPRTQFIMIFDADFIPYPDSITQFLKYFQELCGGLSKQSLEKSEVAVVQGYQWHVLNKSENWVTRGVRSEYAGSYVIERSATELYGGLKQISGSVYMIRADALKQIGWGTSITEDFELTLKLYEQGYKVVYTPYVQAPAEAVSTIKRLIRQRMRWAEGHSFNIKKMLKTLLFSDKLTLVEKLEFMYLSPYYLQAFLFIIGTTCWILAELVFQARLSFWTEVWGWSLILTNMFALPLMNMVGLFMEESEEKDYMGILSFVALSYLVAPFQGYAALKGFLEKEEGPWFRTPKSGRITDTFTPGKFYRFIRGVFQAPRLSPIIQMQFLSFKPGKNTSYQVAPPRIAFAPAVMSNSHYMIGSRKKQSRHIGIIAIAILLVFSLLIGMLAAHVPTVEAATQALYTHNEAADGTSGWPSVASTFRLNTVSPDLNSTEVCGKYGKGAAGEIDRIPSGTNCATALTTTEGSGGEGGGYFSVSQSGTYPAADASNPWKFDVRLRNPTVGTTAGDFMVYAKVYKYDGSTYTAVFYSLYGDAGGCSAVKSARSNGTAVTPSSTAYTLSWSCTNAPAVDVGVNGYLFVVYFIEINTASNSANASLVFVQEGQEVTSCTTFGGGCSKVQTTNFAVPENSLLALPLVPFLPRVFADTAQFLQRIRTKTKRRKRNNDT